MNGAAPSVLLVSFVQRPSLQAFLHVHRDPTPRARQALQHGDVIKATEQLQEAEKRFAELKGMIDLSQEDRVSQQTNLINRMLDTPDPAAGSRK